MNKLFESFVASELKKWLNGDKNSHYKDFMQKIFESENLNNITLKAQEKNKFLAQENDKDIFQLKPDIVAKEQASEEQAPFIADTKWKILSTQENNYNISQSDMYQIFAYLAKYQCKKGFLIYPQIQQDEATDTKEFVFKASMLHTSPSQMSLYVLFFPLCES